MSTSKNSSMHPSPARLQTVRDVLVLLLLSQTLGWLAGPSSALTLPTRALLGGALISCSFACARTRGWGCLGLGTIFFALAASSSVHADSLLELLCLPAHATRWTLPLLAWALGCSALAHRGRPLLALEDIDALGRYAIASTFAAHGLEALLRNPEFVALLEGSAQQLGCRSFPATAIDPCLTLIGLADLALALLLVLGPRTLRTPLLIYVCAWGALTAASRSVAHGFEGVPGTLLRSANWGLPLALLMLGSPTGRSGRRTLRD